MNLHELNNRPGARRDSLRVGRGRGSGRGKTCGRGHKGQMARKGHKHKLGFEGGQMRLVRRIPKRGFTNRNRVEYVPVNVAALGRFDDGTQITVAMLRELGLSRGSSAPVKILGNGDLERKLKVQAHAFSAVARSKIEAAGGACDVVKID